MRLAAEKGVDYIDTGGFFWTELPTALLWTSTTGRARPLQAPSWSWASMNGRVDEWCDYGYRDPASIIHLVCAACIELSDRPSKLPALGCVGRVLPLPRSAMVDLPTPCSILQQQWAMKMGPHMRNIVRSSGERESPAALHVVNIHIFGSTFGCWLDEDHQCTMMKSRDLFLLPLLSNNGHLGWYCWCVRGFDHTHRPVSGDPDPRLHSDEVVVSSLLLSRNENGTFSRIGRCIGQISNDVFEQAYWQTKPELLLLV